MRRRDFIAGIAGSAAGWPFAARAQQPAVQVIGFLSSRSMGVDAPLVAAFHKGLAEAGFVEGSNVAINYRWARGHYDQLPALAAELVRMQVAVLVSTGGTVSARAAKAATVDDSSRVDNCRRSGQSRSGRQSEPAGRQPHRHHGIVHRVPRRSVWAFCANLYRGHLPSASSSTRPIRRP